ncbi:MAG: hypothetical protein WA194_06460 [Patescibacteria group bacterium]
MTLTGGDWNQPNTNYSAGNPDWPKLKINPEKFKLSSVPLELASVFGKAEAAYDPKSVSVGAMDAVLSVTPSGRKRTSSFFQVTGTVPGTGLASVSGNFPTPTAAQTSS